MAPDLRSHDLLFECWWQAKELAIGTGAPLAASQPVVANRYRLDRLIGKGTFGRVYRAHDLQLRRDVALKTVASNASFEGLALARMRHPNVVVLHDQGTEDGTGYLVMELLEGVTLKHWLRAGTRSRAEVMAAYLAAGAGLVAAHDAGLVHRDFKPDNVIIGKRGQVKVLDFGIAASTSGRPAEAVGTPDYAAPEQLAGGRATAASDQFSFCVSLWEALTGAKPFGGRTIAAIVESHREGPRGPRPPGRVGAALERGLHLSPLRRWPSMEALLDELERAQRATVRRPRIVASVVASAVVACAIALSSPVQAVANPVSTAHLSVESLAVLAVSAAEDGRDGEAALLLEAAVLRCRTRQEQQTTASAADEVGLALYEHGHYYDAFESHGKAMDLYEELGDTDLAIRALELTRAAKDARERALRGR